MRHFLYSCLSGRDNASIDVGRVVLVFTMASLVVLEAWQVVARGTEFNAVSFAGACGGLLTAACAALRIKDKTEPT